MPEERKDETVDITPTPEFMLAFLRTGERGEVGAQK
jgi:hypothetical protein